MASKAYSRSQGQLEVQSQLRYRTVMRIGLRSIDVLEGVAKPFRASVFPVQRPLRSTQDRYERMHDDRTLIDSSRCDRVRIPSKTTGEVSPDLQGHSHLPKSLLPWSQCHVLAAHRALLSWGCHLDRSTRRPAR